MSDSPYQALVREIAEMDADALFKRRFSHYDGDSGQYDECRFCGGDMHHDYLWDMRYYDHEKNCLHVRARQLCGLPPARPPKTTFQTVASYPIILEGTYGITVAKVDALGIANIGEGPGIALRNLVAKIEGEAANLRRGKKPTEYHHYRAVLTPEPTLFVNAMVLVEGTVK